MQQPVANRWLSEDLLRLAQTQRDAEHPLSTTRAFISELEQPIHDAPAYSAAMRLPEDDERRRLVLFLTAGALLLGSIAFSYLAWADAGHDTGLDSPLITERGVDDRSATGASSGMGIAAGSELASPSARAANVTRAENRDRVIALRIENAQLHQRLATLQADLEDRDTD